MTKYWIEFRNTYNDKVYLCFINMNNIYKILLTIPHIKPYYYIFNENYNILNNKIKNNL